MNAALVSSVKMDYCTPQEVFDQLDAEFHFTLDAAATDKSAKCQNYYTPETDGLKSPWNLAGGGAVFCNPPYGRQIGKWVQKAYEESKSGTTIVLLIPARTDTTYFHDYIYGRAEVRFIRGRIVFVDEAGEPCKDVKGRAMPAPFPSMVVIYSGKGGTNMTFGEAYAIFQNIDSPDYSDEEKGLAVLKIVNMETHNSIRKDDMLKVIRWLLELSFELPEEKP